MLLLDQLIQRVRADQPSADGDAIRRAHEYVVRAGAGRPSGPDGSSLGYSVSVAGILADLRLDAASVCASLLHHVVYEKLVTTGDVAKEFGGEVASLVDGVTKVHRLSYASEDARSGEACIHALVAIATDIRVILIKLSERLERMRTLGHEPRDVQERVAREGLAVYAPLAHRLGIKRFKSEMEDRCFRCLEPAAYADIEAKMKRNKRERDIYVRRVSDQLSRYLAEESLEAQVSGRAKEPYSIFRKMRARQMSLDRMYDLIAFRVLVASVTDCYTAVSVIHSRWTPIPGRFKDYVALPKPNMYQSLHTNV